MCFKNFGKGIDILRHFKINLTLVLKSKKLGKAAMIICMAMLITTAINAQASAKITFIYQNHPNFI